MDNNGLTKSDNYGNIELNGDGLQGLRNEVQNETLDKIRRK
jgi:hypothetical protein